MRWGGEVALLLALDASCIRMTSFKPGIKLGTETGRQRPGDLPFTAYSVAVLSWCHFWGLVSWRTLLLISSFKEVGEGKQHVLDFKHLLCAGYFAMS